jgi:hypothetical protein
MSNEHRNFIDYFSVCGLDVKSGLEPEPNEANGNLNFIFFQPFWEFFIFQFSIYVFLIEKFLKLL